jgi:hypothetical protein
VYGLKTLGREVKRLMSLGFSGHRRFKLIQAPVLFSLLRVNLVDELSELVEFTMQLAKLLLLIRSQVSDLGLNGFPHWPRIVEALVDLFLESLKPSVEFSLVSVEFSKHPEKLQQQFVIA